MSDSSRLRLVVLRVVVLSILLTLLGRLYVLQVKDGAAYAQAASANRVREIVTTAARGVVLDDTGKVLVGNRTALVVSVNRSILRTLPHDGVDVIARLAAVVHTTPAALTLLITPCGEALPGGKRATSDDGCWSGSPYQPVPVAQYSPDDQRQVRDVLSIEEHSEDFTGVTAQYQAVREYPQKTLAAHVLGYIGPVYKEDLANPKYAGLAQGAQIGRTGLETEYDAQLRGTDGVQRLTVDKDSNVTGVQGAVEATPGQDLVLSLDSGVQQATEKALVDGIMRARGQFDKNRGRNYAAPTGAAVVMDADTGQLVAMASYPTYDPAVFVGGAATKDERARLLKDPAKPLLSNAMQGLYAPGSTFKIASTAGAVAAGYSLTGRDYPCPSSFPIGTGTPKRNFEGESFGVLDFRETLIRSCDTVYYKLAVQQWSDDGGRKGNGHSAEVFTKTARSFGFGAPSGVDLPGERQGLITDRGYKQRAYAQLKGVKCDRAKNGYPEVADKERAETLQAYAKEFCTDGAYYEAGDAANFVIGQGDVLATPLQVASAYSALANGGTLHTPRVAKGFLSADGRTVTPLAPTATRRLPVAKATLDYISSALTGVVRPPGTAKASFAGFPVDQLGLAGKTGTADVNGKSPTSWFASFNRAGGHHYTVVVMVPEGGTGGTTAAPIARSIWASMYGLDGKKAVLQGGALPAGLPVVRSDGSIAPPGTRVPVAPRVVPLVPAVPPTSTALPAFLPTRREDGLS